MLGIDKETSSVITGVYAERLRLAVAMNNCRFKTFNHKYNKYLPCEFLTKLDDKIWKVREYYENKDTGEITTIETCTFIQFIENL